MQEEYIQMKSTHVKCIKATGKYNIGYIGAASEFVQYNSLYWAACDKDGTLVGDEKVGDVTMKNCISGIAKTNNTGYTLNTMDKATDTKITNFSSIWTEIPYTKLERDEAKMRRYTIAHGRGWGKSKLKTDDLIHKINVAGNLRWINRNITKEGNKMLKIKNVVQINGVNRAEYGDEELLSFIRLEKSNIASLEDLDLGSKNVNKKIYKHKRNIAKLVKLLDND